VTRTLLLVAGPGRPELSADERIVAVLATPAGWLHALALAAVLSAPDVARLTASLAEGARPAQLVYPLTDAAWRPQPALRGALQHGLAEIEGEELGHLDLGAFAILEAADASAHRLAAALRPVQVGQQRYPRRVASPSLRLPALQPGAAEAARLATSLAWRPPQLTLIEPGGSRIAPWLETAAPLREATLALLSARHADLRPALRVGLREHAPDRVAIVGGNRALASAVAQALVAEGYHGLRSRSELEAVQASVVPLLSTVPAGA
jgi:hypothetical protein